MVVLVVDDGEAFRRALSKFVRKTGNDVIEAANPTEVRHHLGEGRLGNLNCALVDSNLTPTAGECDGAEVVRLLKQHVPSVYVVAMSACPHNKIPMLAAGADEFWCKLFELDTLRQFIERQCAKSPPS